MFNIYKFKKILSIISFLFIVLCIYPTVICNSNPVFGYELVSRWHL